MHDEAKVAAGFELDPEGARVGVRLHPDQRSGGDGSDDGGGGVLFGRERPWAVTVEVERAETNSSDGHRESEHSAGTPSDGWLPERRPAGFAGRPEVRLED